jgi:hypothetical protein
MKKLEPVVQLTQREFDSLGEYSLSLPTGTTLGKKWKCNRNERRPPVRINLTETYYFRIPWPPDWWLGEYVPYYCPDKQDEFVGIDWKRIEVVAST